MKGYIIIICMYSVILVDDEKRVVDGLKKYIHWETLGFCLCKVFTSGLEALEYVNKNTVDLVITDIEMPKISGLDIIEKINQQHKSTKVVILSAHSDFSYASEAIKYGALYYILKSSSMSEIEDMLLSIKEKLDEIKSVREDADEGNDLLINIKEQFLINIMNGIYSRSKKVPLPPFNISFDIYNAKVSFYDFSLNISEILKRFDQDGIYNILYNLLNMQNGGAAEEYFILIDKSLKIMVLYLDKIRKNNVVDIVKDLCNIDFDYDIKHFNSITAFMESFTDSNDEKILERMICDFRTDILAKRYDDATVLGKEILTTAVQNNADLNSVFEDMFNVLYDKKHNKPINSKNFEYYCETIIQNRNAEEQKCRTAKELIDVIIRYINENLEKDISLRNIANQYYLSCEYLSRIFKKETGQNFKNYVIEKRMERAQLLLSNTDIPIINIASMVGYNDEHYFWLAFRKFYNCTPREFRKNNVVEKRDENDEKKS